jgi:hypothetical protein
MMLVAFDSTQQALRTEMLLEYAEIEIDTRPTPKENNGGCALSIEFPEAELERVKQILRDHHVTVRGIFAWRDGAYVEVE